MHKKPDPFAVPNEAPGQADAMTVGTALAPVPTSAMIDSLDPAEIELWLADGAYRIHRLGNAVRLLPPRQVMRPRNRPVGLPVSST